MARRVAVTGAAPSASPKKVATRDAAPLSAPASSSLPKNIEIGKHDGHTAQALSLSAAQRRERLPRLPQGTTKKIVRPPKYHETKNFLAKESAVKDELDPPRHLGWRAGECYRLAATIQRVMEQAALHVRPVSWGYGAKDGALGHGSTQSTVQVMKKLSAFRNEYLRHVSAGNKLSLFLTSEGRVLQCGRLFLHQDGHKMWKPHEISFAVESQETSGDGSGVPVPRESPVRIASVEAGRLAAYAIDDRGRIFAWGTARYGQLGYGGEIAEVEVVEDAEVNNQNNPGEEGGDENEPVEEKNLDDENENEEPADPSLSKQIERRRDPVQVNPRVIECDALTGVRIVKLSAGNHFVVALSSCGRAFSWGWNWHGQLGLGNEVPRTGSPTPQRITSLEGRIVVDIAAGHSHALAVALPRTDDASIMPQYAMYSLVYAWGRGYQGRLGIGGETSFANPVEVALFRGLHATQVAAGYDHSLVLCSTGARNYVYAFGSNAFGQLGIAHTATSFSDMPMTIEELSGVSVCSISAGAYTSSAVTGDGEVYTWGDGRYGKTGRPDQRTTFVPWKIPHEADSAGTAHKTTTTNHHTTLYEDGFVTQLSMGSHHSLALYRSHGTPDRWRKFAFGNVAAFLHPSEGQSDHVSLERCESSHALSTSVAFGIRLRCESCSLGPLCRVCVRRCHSGHHLVPHFQVSDNKHHQTVACACGKRRPPPRPVPSAPKPTPRNAGRLSLGPRNEISGPMKEEQQEEPPVYCVMASIPQVVHENSCLH